MASELSKKRLALAIIDFLNKSASDGTVAPDDAESIEIATSCIAEAFKVDANDKAAVKDAVGDKSLSQIYSAYELLKGKTSGASASTSSTSAGLDEKTKAEAEKLKSQGNAAMQKKDYDTAIDFYTKALSLVPLNPIYLSNRAAAYSGSGKHEEAVSDAEMAVAADPKFSKAWSRLGYAKFALHDAKGSMEAYKQGIEAEGNGGSEVMRKGYETAKKRVEEEGGDIDEDEDDVLNKGAGGAAPGGMPDLSNLAGMFGGGGGGGGAGGGPSGMPSFAEMMKNPALMQMAQGLMSDPEKRNNLLNNPHLKNMMSGGGMPDIGALMQDPALMDMAKNFMGAGGGAPGGKPPGGSGSGT